VPQLSPVASDFPSVVTDFTPVMTQLATLFMGDYTILFRSFAVSPQLTSVAAQFSVVEPQRFAVHMKLPDIVADFAFFVHMAVRHRSGGAQSRDGHRRQRRFEKSSHRILLVLVVFRTWK
jgi:hypothetical protein